MQQKCTGNRETLEGKFISELLVALALAELAAQILLAGHSNQPNLTMASALSLISFEYHLHSIIATISRIIFHLQCGTGLDLDPSKAVYNAKLTSWRYQ